MRFQKSFLSALLLGFSICLVSLGCGSNGSNPVSPVVNQPPINSGSAANLSFNLVVPPSWKPNIVTDIKGLSTAPTASFELTMFDMLNDKTVTMKRIVEVVNNTVSVTFSNLPPWPTLGKAEFTGAKVSGAASFSGSIDLVSGSNIMTLSPVDSLATTSVAAHILEEIAKDPTKLLNAPAELVSAINTSFSGLDFSTSAIYTTALTQFNTDLTKSGTTASTAAKEAKMTKSLNDLVFNIMRANHSDFSSLATISLPSIRAATVVAPTLPTVAPQVPSSIPTIASTTTFGEAPDITTVDWYMYVSPLDLTSSWSEWKTTVLYNSTPTLTAYWKLFPPSSKTSTSQTRKFEGSSWESNNLHVYTIGTATYDVSGDITASGTQVANVTINGTKTQVVYSFEVTSKADGSATGNVVINEGGTVAFSRTAFNEAAIGTANQYYQTTGTITITTPVARTLTFTLTVLGNDTETYQLVSSSITTDLTFKADGSGSGSVSGAAGRGIALEWDGNGVATATITILNQTKTISSSVLLPISAEIPNN